MIVYRNKPGVVLVKLLSLSCIGILQHGSLFAQQEQRVEKIEVTGSNIKRVDTETPAPVQIITKEEIDRSGKATVAEVLRAIPSNTGNTFNETFVNSFSPGASGISLRGLGQKSTLVLVNGRRVANYGFAQNIQDTYVDLNSIPTSAVERVEVLRDGASAVYGSDAIGGVVNIILRRDYRGVELALRGGRATEGGLAERKFAVTAGYGDIAKQRFNIMAVFDYYHRDLLLYSEREFTRDQDFRGRAGGLFQWSANAGTYRIGSNRIPFATCPAGQVLPATLFQNITGNVCGYNPAPYLTLFPESERMGLISRATFNISQNVSAFAEFWYNKNETEQTSTPLGVAGSVVAFDPRSGGVRTVPAVLPVGNPSNPFSQPTQIGYTFFDVGGRNQHIETKFNRALVGLKGVLRDWDWEIAAGSSRSDTVQTNFNDVNATVFSQVLADGTYNFLNPSATPQATARLRANHVRQSDSKLSFADLKVSTDLMQLPAGALGFAAGIEYRRESIKDRPDPLLTSGQVLGRGSSSTDGSRNSTAGYIEFSVPALKSVELQIAGRQDHYSDFGNAFSPKVGVKWTPNKQLLLRGSYAKGFRAPSLPEISPTTVLSFVTIRDPRQNNQSFSVGRLSISNPNVEAERSQSYTVGFIVEPNAAFNFGADYYHIRQNKLVQRDSPQFVVNNEGQPGFEGRVVRDVNTGNIAFVTTPFRNIEFQQTSGIDFDYRLRLPKNPYGRFTLSGQWNYLIEFKRPVAEGQPATRYTGNNGFFTALPRFRGNTRLSWERDSWLMQLTGNYTHSYSQVIVIAGAPIPSDSKVKSRTTFDLYLAYNGFKNTNLYISVLNISDQQPPFDPGASTGLHVDFGLYDLRGRTIQVGANYKF